MENTHRINRLEILKRQQDLFALVNEVQPGYFREQTAALGNYYGIHDRGKLVACCGERMKMEKLPRSVLWSPNPIAEVRAMQNNLSNTLQTPFFNKTKFLTYMYLNPITTPSHCIKNWDSKPEESFYFLK